MKGTEAERELERFLQAQGWVSYRRTGGGRFQKVRDIFGCLDVLAFWPSGNGEPPGRKDTWGVQVTTRKCVASRKRKVERVSWPRGWRVSVICHDSKADPGDGRKRIKAWVCWDFLGFSGGKPVWGKPSKLQPLA